MQQFINSCQRVKGMIKSITHMYMIKIIFFIFISKAFKIRKFRFYIRYYFICLKHPGIGIRKWIAGCKLNFSKGTNDAERTYRASASIQNSKRFIGERNECFVFYLRRISYSA